MSEFDEWVVALPKSMEASLRVGDVVSTAFWQARRAGWDVDALVFDSLAAVRRGAGTGALVERMRTLATQRPGARQGARSSTPTPPRHDPPPMVTYSASQARERVQLLHRIKRERWTPDEAEAAMVALIAEQNGGS